MWESYLFCLEELKLFLIGGDTIFFFFGRGRYYVSCFTLLIDLYLWVINDICEYVFIVCYVKSRIYFLFTCIFHTCIYAFVECFRKYTGWFSHAAVYICNWWIVVRFDYFVMGIIFVKVFWLLLVTLSIMFVFCHRLPKREFVRF